MQLKILGIISFLVMMLGNVSVTVGASGISHRDIFVGASARAVGMGSAFTAGPSTSSGFLWNPSSLGFMDGLELNMGGIPFSGAPSGASRAFSLSANPYTLGLTKRNIGNLSAASWFDGWDRNATESTQIVLLGYGFALSPRASAGMNLRYYQNNTSLRKNFLWSLDLGMQFAYPLKKFGDSLTVGVNLSELSNGIREAGKLVENAPLAARFGTIYNLNSETLFSADMVIRGQNDVANWGERVRLHFGAERWFLRGHLGARVGYTALTAVNRFSQGEWTQGLSLRNSAGQLDYAYVNGNELEAGLHWISATLRWGGPREAFVPAPAADTKQVDAAKPAETAPILMPKKITPDTPVVEIPAGELQLSERAISPDNDGIADSTTFRFNVNPNDKWQLILRDEYTEKIWEKSGTGPPSEDIVWDGTGNTGKLVLDGDYAVEFYVFDAQGTPQLRKSDKVTVDLIPATLEIFQKTAASVGLKVWDINPLLNWKLEIFNAGKELLEKTEGDGSPPASVELTKIPTLSPGTYTCKLSVQDIAGNQSVQETQLQLGTASQTPVTKPKFSLMVGSFAERHNADMLVENLQRLYPSDKVKIYTVAVDGKTRHRVTIGEFAARTDAATLKQQIQESQGVEPMLITLQ